MKAKDEVAIFIVEDDKIFTLALKANIEKAFENKKIKIHSFVAGETGIEKLKEENPRVVILDYHLDSKYHDVANGIEVLDWIKKENPETCVIIITGDDNNDIALKSFHHGAHDYVFKSETIFLKINYSLSNLFKTMKHKSEARRYKNLVVGMLLCVAFLVGGLIAIHIVEPSLLK